MRKGPSGLSLCEPSEEAAAWTSAAGYACPAFAGVQRRQMGLTRKRDLRTGSAVWTAYRHASIPMRRLKRATQAHVVVVGAGITGAIVSQALTEAGINR